MFGGPSRHLRQMRYTISPYERTQWVKRNEYDSARPRSQAFNVHNARAQHQHNAPSTMSEDIMAYYETKKQSSTTYQKKMNLRESLFTVMKNVFPYCGLYVTGSSMNGFGADSSDMDLTLMISNYEINREESFGLIRCLAKSLRKCSFVRNIQTINAICPILKFTDTVSGLECDMSINNSVGIRNTHLLNVYSQLDSRVAPLVMFVKRWAKFHNINDPLHQTISSYSLVLMVIHYLQVCNPPVLPSLQTEFPRDFSSESDIRLLTLSDPKEKYQFTSTNTVDVGQLFMGFLNYYSNIFDFGNLIVSTRLGKTISKADAMAATHNNKPRWKYVCIEEPFNLSNTARSVHREDAFMLILYVFQKSYTMLHEDRDLRRLFSRPL